MLKMPIKNLACTLAVASLLAACGGGGSTPDTTAPSVTITDNVSGIATSDITFTFTFNEAVNGFNAEDITVANGTKGPLVMAANNLSATMVVTPTANSSGTVQINIAAGSFTDISNNAVFNAVNATQDYDTRSLAPPLIANGNFSGGITGWSGNAANVQTEGGNSFNFANVAAAGNPYDVNLSYVLNIPNQGTRYKLTFVASSNRTRALKAGIGLNSDPWTNTVQDVTLTTTPQTFELELISNFASSNSRVLFDMGHDTGHVVIDDVVLEILE